MKAQLALPDAQVIAEPAAPPTFSPAVSEAIGAPVPLPDARFWPRLARAGVLMSVAIALHVWVVASPNPRPSALPAFAAWFIATPPIPLAPPDRWLDRFRVEAPSTRPVVVQSTLVRVGTPPRAVDGPSREWQQPGPIAVGTSGHLLAVALKPSSIVHRALDVPLDVVPSPEVEAPPVLVSAPSRAPEPVATVVHTPPPPEPTARPAESRRPPAAGSMDDERKQKEIVLAVLREYSRAYERLDVKATKAVYPSVDDIRLQRAFEDLQGQEMRFASCGVLISSSGADANARCKGDATYRPKVGSRVVRLTDRVWTFSLSRDGGGWQILNARMQ